MNGKNLPGPFFLAEAQGRYLVFLAEGPYKAGDAAVPAGPGDFLNGGAGMDQQFWGSGHAAVFDKSPDSGVIAQMKAGL